MSIRERVQRWLGIDGVRRAVASDTEAIFDQMQRNHKELMAKITPGDATKPTPARRLPAINDWDAIQAQALSVFEDSKKGN